MSDAGWLAVAFGAVAAGIGGYLASLVARRRRLERRKEELTRR
jgi:CcmD family protein